MTLTDEQLLDVLHHVKLVSDEKLATAKDFAKKSHTSLYQALLDHEILTEEQLGEVAAYHYKLPYVALQKINIPNELLRLMPAELAKRYQIIAFQLEDSTLHIATARPGSEDLFDMLAKKAGAHERKISYANEAGIESALHLFKRDLQGLLDELMPKENTGAAPVAKIVDSIFDYAYDAQASDIHIEPLRGATVLRFRIDGVLHDEAYFSKSYHNQMVARFKVMAKLRTDEHMGPQDGRMRIKVRGQELAVRLSIVPQVTGEKVVMRVLARQVHQFNLSELGMTDDNLGLVRKGFTRPYGMLLSTGPTGSGKTTTIYAILKILNGRNRNIATIEDPIEYELEGINQIQVNAKANLTFEEGLRSLMRQDPDVLFVGEIRDNETAAIAVNAAMTGHMVLTTMHTNDAVTTLPRLADMGIEPYLVASTTNIVIGQRLVRQICERCKASIKITHTAKGWVGDEEQTVLLSNISKAMFIKHFGNKATIRVYKGNGCSACHNTGYQGRLGIFEVLQITPKLAELISAKSDSESLQAQAVKDGMITMLDDGLDKVVAGETTLSEIMRVTKL
ncbi:MAG TPA: GspE/PulE family protein [Candidatus Saccharimonadales bacterium]|nr:GspE/PulE family protein [Candidatus Saccharimonadales bacterium]